MNSRRRLSFVVVVACWSVTGGSAPPVADCRLKGVWEMVAVTNNGKDAPLNGYRQMKVVTGRHFMWIGEDPKRDTLPLKTGVDTLRAYIIGGGAGTYSVTGDKYVEQIEFFNDPQFIGKPWNATCRVEGERWYHSFTVPNDTSVTKVVEVWRRVE